jgi:hypothetical protein
VRHYANLMLISLLAVLMFVGGSLVGMKYQEGKDRATLQRAVELVARGAGLVFSCREELEECVHVLKNTSGDEHDKDL